MDGSVVGNGLLVVEYTVRLRQRVALAEVDGDALGLGNRAGRGHERKSDGDEGGFAEHGGRRGCSRSERHEEVRLGRPERAC